MADNDYLHRLARQKEHDDLEAFVDVLVRFLKSPVSV